MSKKTTKELQAELKDSAHKIWLAGLGALSAAEDEGGKLFKNLVERGQEIEKRGKKHADKARDTVSGVVTVAESYWETFEKKLDEKVTATIHRLGVPTKDEIDGLTKKVEDLTAAVDKLRQAGSKADARTRAAAKKTTEA